MKAQTFSRFLLFFPVPLYFQKLFYNHSLTASFEALDHLHTCDQVIVTSK